MELPLSLRVLSGIPQVKNVLPKVESVFPKVNNMLFARWKLSFPKVKNVLPKVETVFPRVDLARWKRIFPKVESRKVEPVLPLNALQELVREIVSVMISTFIQSKNPPGPIGGISLKTQ